MFASLYVYDFQIGYCHSDLLVIAEKLQNFLNILNDWTFQNGFKFSINKTNVVYFSHSSSLVSLPDLYLENHLLPYSNTTRFLGLVWDKKLAWVPHINQLKAQCSKLLNLLRSLTSQTWGADQYCCLKLYRMFIRSKLDYGCIVYDSARKHPFIT